MELFGTQWDLHFTTNLLQLASVHEMGIKGSGTRLAIIECGCNYTHESLRGKITIAPLSQGFNLPNTFNENFQHGTAVAGIAAGRPYEHGNNKFPGGVAPEADVTMFRIDINNFNTVYQALDQISKGPVFDVVSISLGIYDKVELSMEKKFRDVISQLRVKGTVIFVASGNIGNRGNVAFPAYLDGVISVGALDSNAKLHPTARDKGVDIYCYGEVIAPRLGATSGTGELCRMCGSSFATPAAAGLACLAIQCAKKWNYEELKHKDKILTMFNEKMQARGKTNVLEPSDFLIAAFQRDMNGLL